MRDAVVAGRAPLIDPLRGTPEEWWQTWIGLGDLPAWAPGTAGRVVVAAPHPDDEVLGVGGTMAHLVGRGWDVEVVAVTDGEAATPDASATERARLGRARQAESRLACHRLGLGDMAVHRLGLPDGRVAEGEDGLSRALAARLEPGCWCLAPWRGDGHPDHEATGRAAARACAETGARLGEYPVWAWHWSIPGDARLPWARARGVVLTEEVRAAKRSAIAAFASQVRPREGLPPVLPAAVLAHFDRPLEVLWS